MKRILLNDIGDVLIALGHKVGDSGKSFTVDDLSTWALGKQRFMAVRSIQVLIRHELVVGEGGEHGHPAHRWTLTPKGVVTCSAAYLASPSKSMPDPQSLAMRLWTLLRVRKSLTAEEAASLLVDAADDAAYMRTRRTLMSYLKYWAKTTPHAIQRSARRVGGFTSFVMLQDLGVYPPSLRTRVKPAVALKNVSAKVTGAPDA